MRRFFRVLAKAAKWGAVLLIAVLIGTSLYARYLRHQDLVRWRPPGRLVAVEPGRQMHLYCTGTGFPTIVLEAGLGDFSLSSWASVQPRLASISRVCSYDRAGTGWSDPPRVAPTATSITTDLHDLLTKAGEVGPYVLVGHSLGGPLARHYVARYPHEVGGLVLVDGSHEEQMERLKGIPTWAKRIYEIFPAVHFVGLDRLASLSAADTMSQLAGALTTSDKALDNTLTLMRALEPFMAEVHAARVSLGDRPTVALSAAKMTVPGAAPEVSKAMHAEWLTMHREIAAMSTRGRAIVAESAGHYIQREEPELVIAAVRHVVESVRAEVTVVPDLAMLDSVVRTPAHQPAGNERAKRP